MTYQPELLCPAGNPAAMKIAFAYGADAVYAGEPRYSLRVRNNSFTLANLGESIDYAHNLGKRFYVVLNIAPHNAKLTGFIEHIEKIVALKPDALIVSDPGIVMLLKQYFPQQALHLSVQANTVNWAALKFWQAQGIERVILSRELSLNEIAEMREQVPDMEIEVFVHGALCMAYSGRCLLSGYTNKRDPNQGACTNACRWKYSTEPARVDEIGQYVPDPMFVADPLRPDEPMLLDEDDHGSYLMNSKDLRAVDLVEELVAMGVHSLKIEGRTKSDYYVARTTQVYRNAIDDALAGKPFNPQLLKDLEGMANRGFTHGFLKRHSAQDLQNYETSHSVGTEQMVGQLLSSTDNKYLAVDVRNAFCVGDAMTLITPKGNKKFVITTISDGSGVELMRAPGSGYQVYIPLENDIATDDIPYCFLVRAAL